MAGSQIKHIDFTLSGTSQNIGASLTDAQLAILLGGTAPITLARTQKPGITNAEIAERYMFKSLSIQSAPANSGVVYIGGGAQTVSSSSYGIIIPIPATTVPAPPLIYPSQAGVVMRLNDVTVLGTANDIIHLLLQEW